MANPQHADAAQAFVQRVLKTFPPGSTLFAKGKVNGFRRGLRAPFEVTVLPHGVISCTRLEDMFQVEINLWQVYTAHDRNDCPYPVDSIDTFFIPPEAMICMLEIGQDAEERVPLVGKIDFSTKSIHLDAKEQNNPLLNDDDPRNFHWFYLDINFNPLPPH